MKFTDLEDSAGFDTYDPEYNGFDPEEVQNFGGRKRAANAGGTAQPVRQKQKAYFDLTFTNGAATVKTVELFNFFRSFTRFIRADYSNDVAYGYYPLSTREGMEALINNVIPVGNRTPANQSNIDIAGAGYVGFNKTGDLIITKAGAVGNEIVKVACSQFPYSGLLESSSQQPFRITRIRMTTTTDGQISNPIVTFKNSFLGSKSQNEINPRNFFNPNQFQTKIIDIPLDFGINGQSGILYTLAAGETVQWNIEVESYSLNQV